MRQRVSMARTLASEPKILLMDEPFAALDEQTRLLLGDKVLQIQQELKQTTLLITHNITEAVQLSDRILVMTYRPGRVKRIVEIKLPRPRTSEIVGSDAFGRYVAQIWSDLREEATKGLARRGGHAAARGRAADERRGGAGAEPISVPVRRSASRRSSSYLAVVELLIRIGVINRFIVPPPSDIVAALPAHHRRGERPVALPADLRRGAGGEHHAQHRRHRARRAAASLVASCGWRPRPGWRRSRRRRWC